ncbi:MAG: hypothetical protein NC311_06410 [Muribaculaceae bacterium]|nr:hypothetical protein [Muribaculaceae bacterium]
MKQYKTMWVCAKSIGQLVKNIETALNRAAEEHLNFEVVSINNEHCDKDLGLTSIITFSYTNNTKTEGDQYAEG